MSDYIPVEDILIEPHREMDGVFILTFRGRSFQYSEDSNWFKIASCRGPTFIPCNSLATALDLVYAVALRPDEHVPNTLNYNDVELQNPDSPYVLAHETALKVRKCIADLSELVE